METHIYKVIFGLGSSFILIFWILPKFINFSKKKNLMDVPNQRASHVQATPTSGGITFIAALMIAFLWSSHTLFDFILLISFISISMLGFLDDRFNLSPLLKLFVEAIFVFVITQLGISSLDLEKLIGLNHLPEIVSFLFTFFIIAGLTNAFNLIDGIDGLAGGIALINTLCFGTLFYVEREYSFALIHFSLAGGILAFLVFNFHPAKIFMGDVGSLLIGALMGVSFLKILSFENSIATTISFSLLLIPCIDMLRLFIVRILNKKSPFAADRNHYHHLLLKTGDNHKSAAIICYLLHLILIGLGYLLLNYFTLLQTNFILLGLSVTIYVLVELRFLSKNQVHIKELNKKVAERIESNHLLKKIHFNK